MFARISSAIFLTVILSHAAPAQPAPRRVALVIGQNAYAALDPLVNPRLDAQRMAKTLVANGFDVIACDGVTPGCFDLSRDGLIAALAQFALKAKDADLALTFYAGHGMETAAGNILAPVDASVDCTAMSVGKGVLVDEFLQAAAQAKHKVVILDACRDQPLGKVCPPLAAKKPLSFKKIEAGDTRNLLLVSSTQFGQQALDGADGQHSPFAAALFAALDANPRVYFDQIMNQVAKATYDYGQTKNFSQIPGRVVGGEAPADCLAGKDCIGDVRMAALASQIEALAAESKAAQADASGVRAIIAADEKARGKPYAPDERAKRIAEIGATLANFGASSDPLKQEARRLIDGGNVSGGQAKLDEALDADEKAAAEAEKLVADKRQAAARTARDLAVLARGSNVAKAADYYARAVKLEPGEIQTWLDYARAAQSAGRLGEAKAAFEQAASRGRDVGSPGFEYWATLGLGVVAILEGRLVNAREHFKTAIDIVEPRALAGNIGSERDLSVALNRLGDVLLDQGDVSGAKDSYASSVNIMLRLTSRDRSSADWQRDLMVAHNRLGDALVAQGQLPEALISFRDALLIGEQLAKSDPGNARWQRDVSVSQEKIGDVFLTQGKFTSAIIEFRESLAVAARLVKADPSNTEWQRDLSVAYDRVGEVLVVQGNHSDALIVFQYSLANRERLVRTDPGNTQWQRDLSVSHNKVGDVLAAQGNLSDALKSFRDGLGIVNRLARIDPGNVVWQRDLAVSYDRVGDILFDQGDFAGSLVSFGDSLATAEHLAKIDPGNTGWQRDIAVSHSKIGGSFAKQGERSRALDSFRQGRDIIAKLMSASPTNAQLPKDFVYLNAQIGKLEKK